MLQYALQQHYSDIFTVVHPAAWVVIDNRAPMFLRCIMHQHDHNILAGGNVLQFTEIKHSVKGYKSFPGNHTVSIQEQQPTSRP